MSQIRLSIDERFERFHRLNPEVLDQLIELARAAKARGYTRYSIKGLWEVLRYRADPTTSERYRLSNDFTSRFARLVMSTAKDLEGFFVLRELSPEPGVSSPGWTDEDDLGSDDTEFMSQFA